MVGSRFQNMRKVFGFVEQSSQTVGSGGTEWSVPVFRSKTVLLISCVLTVRNCLAHCIRQFGYVAMWRCLKCQKSPSLELATFQTLNRSFLKSRRRRWLLGSGATLVCIQHRSVVTQYAGARRGNTIGYPSRTEVSILRKVARPD